MDESLKKSLIELSEAFDEANNKQMKQIVEPYLRRTEYWEKYQEEMHVYNKQRDKANKENCRQFIWGKNR